MREHRIKYPFVLVSYDGPFDGEYAANHKSWVPGVDQSLGYEDDSGDFIAFADGEGVMLLTEIDRHKLPAPYPERVFYLREWIDPNGRRFGKRNLRITTSQAFERQKKGFRYQYSLENES